ncbi:serine hydrolase domain-containing protein [Flavihumibacter stibioxidans]|uniref:Beta-lactamase-related domain-containing protein n=1 Tax=Flavihumibacter stibioxidans TaxID=1834163 RepID=A0ABR7MA34_9BACT|nr:serine hydrolase domain-containing protein [Flavihumibacter stibioxidans]MBC6491899.1 hypothetical protein [Flavihumibacter stibioxidans]
MKKGSFALLLSILFLGTIPGLHAAPIVPHRAPHLPGMHTEGFKPFIICTGDTTRIHLTPSDADSITLMINRSDFSGSFLLVQDGKTILSVSRGMASESEQRPNSPQTRFNIGSIGKSLTAILIMQLVERNKLALDRPVNSYLPDRWKIVNGGNITIRHCLNQTSGLGDFFDHPKYNDSTTHTIDQHMELVRDMKLVSDTPGLKLHYSNSGFIVLGKILELLHKKPYQEIVMEQLLNPAGIRYRSVVPYSTGYAIKEGKKIIGEGNNPSHWTSAGGIFLTTEELNLLITALLQEKYITRQSIAQTWAKESHPEHEPPFVHYGLGWMVEDPGGLPLRGHNGGMRGFQASFRHLPSDNLSFYIFSNMDNGAEQVFMQVLFYLMGKKFPGRTW